MDSKFELLKSIVDSTDMLYPLHNDIPTDERRLIEELETEGFLYLKSKYSLKPTKEALILLRNFNSFDEYYSFKQNNSNINTTSNIVYNTNTNTNINTNGFAKVIIENDSKKTEKKDTVFSKIITWAVTLFKKQL